MKRGTVSLICFASLLLAGNAWSIGDFGPDTCMEGFVWREACGAGDHVCVPLQTREQALQDNAAAPGRVQPGGGPFGPDTCRPGFVWREACGPADHVCVSPQVRSQAAADNNVRGARLKYPHCQSYARDAVRANVRNAWFSCHFEGPRWQDNEGAHFSWCLNSLDRDVANEMAGRYSALDHCNPEAGRQARGIPPPTNTGAPGSTPPGNPGNPPRCCFIPVVDSSGAIGVGHTCGPACP
jgi:hypothetical protein